MMIDVCVHLTNQTCLFGQLEQLPQPKDGWLLLYNPRVLVPDQNMLQTGTKNVLIAVQQVVLIEITTPLSPTQPEELIFSFVRE